MKENIIVLINKNSTNKNESKKKIVYSKKKRSYSLIRFLPMDYISSNANCFLKYKLFLKSKKIIKFEIFFNVW